MIRLVICIAACAVLLGAKLIPFTPLTEDENRYLQDMCGRMSTPFDQNRPLTQAKILNGNPVEAGFGSWLVRMDDDTIDFAMRDLLPSPPESNGVHCCGTLISPRHILTASHCGIMVANENHPFRFRVRVSKQCTTRSCTKDVDVYEVKSVVSLPISRKLKDYEMVGNSTMYYGADLTLVELTEPVNLTKVQPACLNTDPAISSKGRFVAVGWGYDDQRSSDRILWSEQLFNGTREDSVRAVALDGKQMTHQGDSGSGLMMVTDRVYVLGPLSNGPTKKELDDKLALPLSLYTNAAKFVNFICHFTGVCPPGASRDGDYVEGRDFNVCEYDRQQYCRMPAEIEVEE